MKRILVITGTALVVLVVLLLGMGAATPSVDGPFHAVIERILQMPVMETVSGSFTEYYNTYWPHVVQEYYYPQPRHVTVTLYYENLVGPWQGFGIFAEIGGKLVSITEVRHTGTPPPTSGILKADFTTTHWQVIDEEENGHSTIAGYYSAKIEYVP